MPMEKVDGQEEGKTEARPRARGTEAYGELACRNEEGNGEEEAARRVAQKMKIAVRQKGGQLLRKRLQRESGEQR